MSVKSAVRVVRIFELLSNHPDGLTVKEISKELSVASEQYIQFGRYTFG